MKEHLNLNYNEINLDESKFKIDSYNIILNNQMITTTFSIENIGEKEEGLAILQISYDPEEDSDNKWFDEKTTVVESKVKKVITTHASRKNAKLVIVSSTKSKISGKPGEVIDIKDYLLVNTSDNSNTEEYINQVSLGYKSSNTSMPISNDGVLTLTGESTLINIYAKNVGDSNYIRIIVEGIPPVMNEEELRYALSTGIDTIEIGADITISEEGGMLDIGRVVTIEGNDFTIEGDLKYSLGASGAELKDINVDGNIIIDVEDGSGSSTVFLTDVTVNPSYNITILSGGVNSIELKNVVAPILNINGICRVCLDKRNETDNGCTFDEVNISSLSSTRMLHLLDKNISERNVAKRSSKKILDVKKAAITDLNVYGPLELMLSEPELSMEGEYDAVVEKLTAFEEAKDSDITVNSRGLIKNADLKSDNTDTIVNTGGLIEYMSMDGNDSYAEANERGEIKEVSIKGNDSTVTVDSGGEIGLVSIEAEGVSVEATEDSKLEEVYVNGNNASITGKGTEETKIEIGPDVTEPPEVEGCIITDNTAEVSTSIGLNYALQLSNIDTINMTEGTFHSDTFEITKPITITGANNIDEHGEYISKTIVKVENAGSTIVYVHDCQDVNMQWITFDRDEKAGIAVLFAGFNDFNNSTVSDCKVIGIPGEQGSNQFCALEALNGSQNIIFERNIVEGFHAGGYSAGIGFVFAYGIIIRNNIIDGQETGQNGILGIFSGSGEVIENNIMGCITGIYQNQVNFNIENNNIYSNQIGIQAWTGEGWTTSIRRNRIYNNTEIALVGSNGIDASENYWGTDDITTVIIQGDIIYAPYYLDEEMTELSIPVESINVRSEGDVDSVIVGNALRMYADILPLNATLKSVEWSLEPEEGIASIDDEGLLTAEAEGIVTVTAKAKDGSQIKGTKNITVTTEEEI